ncbi:hypothetical protein [Nocardia sp. NPDC052566]|uniref:hypothetical protein n=1 Tax=Nocardia sp. NPDC052566 TaxID=3364330 RepID=UPI0037CAE367
MRISVKGDSEGVRVRMRLEQQRRWLATRILLAILAIQGTVTGLWATVAPRSFYDDFPGFGMHWVSVDGPYNHHLAADVGAFFLALAAVTIAALYLDTGNAARVTGLGWFVFALPHFIYHATHRPAEMTTGSFTISLISTMLLVLLGLACVIVPPRGAHLPDPNPIHLRFPRRRTR